MPSTSGISPIPILKKTHLGRPRGRPPGSTSIRTQRGRPPGSTNSTYMSNLNNPLFDQNAALDYLRNYQKELLLQYSKTIGLQQMAQFAQMSQNQQLQSTLLLQSMQQMNLLNSSILNSSFNNLANMNPNMFKKAMEQVNLSAVNLPTIPPNFDNITPPAAANIANKKNITSTITSKTNNSSGNNANKANLPVNSSLKMPQTSSIYNPQQNNPISSNFAMPEASKLKAPSNYQVRISILFFKTIILILWFTGKLPNQNYKRKRSSFEYIKRKT